MTSNVLKNASFHRGGRQRPYHTASAAGVTPSLGSFTLVELLVVIAIIGLLAALLAPALTKTRDMVRQVSCVNQIRQLGFLIHIYAGQYDGQFLPVWDDDNNFWQTTLVNAKLIKPTATSSPATDKTLICPSSKVTDFTPDILWWGGQYGMNAYTGYATGGWNSNPILLSATVNPGRTILLMDNGNFFARENYITAPALGTYYVPGSSANAAVAWPLPGQYEDAVKGRHAGKVNICFIDGHVSLERAADLTSVNQWWDPRQ